MQNLEGVGCFGGGSGAASSSSSHPACRTFCPPAECYYFAQQLMTNEPDAAVIDGAQCSHDATSRIGRAPLPMTHTALLPVGSEMQHAADSQVEGSGDSRMQQDAISSSEGQLANDHDQATSRRHSDPVRSATAAARIQKSSGVPQQHLPAGAQVLLQQGDELWEALHSPMLFSAAAVLLHGRGQPLHLPGSYLDQLQHATSWDAVQEAELQLAAEQAWGSMGSACSEPCARRAQGHTDAVPVQASGEWRSSQAGQQVLQWCLPAAGMQGLNEPHAGCRPAKATPPGCGVVLQSLSGCAPPSSSAAAEILPVLATGSHSISLPTELTDVCGWVTPAPPISHKSSTDVYGVTAGILHARPPGGVHALPADGFAAYSGYHYIQGGVVRREMHSAAAVCEPEYKAVPCRHAAPQLLPIGCKDSRDNMTGHMVFIQQASGVLTPCLVVQQQELGQSCLVDPSVHSLRHSSVGSLCGPHSRAYTPVQQQSSTEQAAMPGGCGGSHPTYYGHTAVFEGAHCEQQDYID